MNCEESIHDKDMEELEPRQSSIPEPVYSNNHNTETSKMHQEDYQEPIPYVTGDVSIWKSKAEIRNSRSSGKMLARKHWREKLVKARGQKITQFATGFGNAVILTDAGNMINLLADSDSSETKEAVEETQPTVPQTWLAKKLASVKDIGVSSLPSGQELVDFAQNSGLEFSHIAVGKGFAAGVGKHDSKLYSWGAGVEGQLGIGHSRGAAGPTRVRMDAAREVDQVVCGEAHMVVLCKEGNVFTSGRGFEGQLGQSVSNEVNLNDMPQMSVRLAPKYVQGLLSIRVTKIGCGHRFSVALSDQGTLWTWGEGTMGQLGDGRCTKRSKPVMVVGPPNLVARNDQDNFDLQEYNKAILAKRARGELGSLLLDKEIEQNGTHPILQQQKSVSSWLLLDTNSRSETEEDKELLPTERPVWDFVCGAGHVVCLNDIGQLMSWGFNLYGQLGLGDVKTRFFPEIVTIPNNENPEFVQLAAGDYTTAAIDRHGYVWQWGARMTTHSVTPDVPGELDDPISLGMVQSGASNDKLETESFLSHTSTSTSRESDDEGHAITVPRKVTGLGGNIASQIALTQNDLIIVSPAIVTGLEPSTGGMDGGTTLKISGSGFWSDDRILVRFTPILHFSEHSDLTESDGEGAQDDGKVDFDDVDDSGSSVGESSVGDEDNRDVEIVPGYYDDEAEAVVCSTPMFSRPGLVEVEVSIDGIHFTTNGFRFLFFELPEVHSVSPPWAPHGEETTFVLEGTRFAANEDLQVRLRTVELMPDDGSSTSSFKSRSITDLKRPSHMYVDGQTYKIKDEFFLPATYKDTSGSSSLGAEESEDTTASTSNISQSLSRKLSNMGRKSTQDMTQSGFGASTRSVQSMVSVSGSKSTRVVSEKQSKLDPTVEFVLPKGFHFPSSELNADSELAVSSVEDESTKNKSLDGESIEPKKKDAPIKQALVSIPMHKKPVQVMIDLAMNGVDFTSCGKSIILSDLAITSIEPSCAPSSIPVGEVREIALFGTGIVEPSNSNALQVRFVLNKIGGQKEKIKPFMVKAKRKKLSSSRYEGPLTSEEKFYITCQAPKIGSNIFTSRGNNCNKLTAKVQASLDSGTTWVTAIPTFSFYQAEVYNVSPVCGPSIGGNTVRLRVAHPDSNGHDGQYLTASNLVNFFGSCQVKVKVIVEGTKKSGPSTITVSGAIDGVTVSFVMPKIPQFTSQPEQKPKKRQSARQSTASKLVDDDTEKIEPDAGAATANDAQEAGEEKPSAPVVKAAPVGMLKFRVALNGVDFSAASPKYTMYSIPTISEVSPREIAFAPLEEPKEPKEDDTVRVDGFEPVRTEFVASCQGLYDTGCMLVRLEEVEISENGLPIIQTSSSRPASASSTNSVRPSSATSSNGNRPINFTTTPDFNASTGELTFTGPPVTKVCALLITVSINGVDYLKQDPLIVKYVLPPPPPAKGKKGK